MPKVPWTPADATKVAPAHHAVLERLLGLRQRAQALEDEINQTAQDARDAGASWAELGAAMGVSGPAAYQRWSEDGRAKHAARQRKLRGAHRDEAAPVAAMEVRDLGALPGLSLDALVEARRLSKPDVLIKLEGLRGFETEIAVYERILELAGWSEHDGQDVSSPTPSFQVSAERLVSLSRLSQALGLPINHVGHLVLDLVAVDLVATIEPVAVSVEPDKLMSQLLRGRASAGGATQHADASSQGQLGQADAVGASPSEQTQR